MKSLATGSNGFIGSHLVRSRFREQLYCNYIDKKNLIKICSEANTQS